MVQKSEKFGTRAKKFLAEVKAPEEKYQISISHEDNHGAFLLHPYNKDDADWLMDASYGLYKDE